MDKVTEIDKFNEFRRLESRLNNVIGKRLHVLQFPSDCRTVKN